ncbi:hypothetical protein [Campylobacter coli]|uniref:hypothetical protein n=1 Tax=Campylobacter coli TaxID=195 RepID=UPI0025B25A1C|nr:hypothetical protein [Campylobacter coli]MDN2923866.1 hypothetical protein [Campylobacter coli]
MKKYILMLALLFGISGCVVNERGISNRFYDDCHEYYDASGTYHKDCPKNCVDINMTP